MTIPDGISAGAIVSGLLALYALTYFAGGIYYLEQRVARVRDQFPRRALLARLTGYTALCIGTLAATSAAGQVLSDNPAYRLGGLVAALAGMTFWVYRIYVDLTPARRVVSTST